MNKKEFYTEKEVAEITAIPLKTLRNLRWQRRIFPFFKIGKSVRYRISDVKMEMDKNQIKTNT